MKKLTNIAIVAIWAAIIAGIMPCMTVGPSMLPTLQTKNLCIINYSDRNPERGDIISLLPYGDVANGPAILGALDAGVRREKVYCKRVVGLPGDIVEASGGVLLVNGRPFDDLPTDNFDPVMVGEGEYFVLGDNRCNSLDSRILGCIRESQILGTVIWHL